MSESMSERELAEQLFAEVYSDQPRSVGEALTAADAATTRSRDARSALTPQLAVAEPPVVVEDEPRDIGEGQPEPEVAPEVEPEPEVEDSEGDIEEDENVAWAVKKYGDDPAKWAQAARAQERHISKLAGEKKEAEDLAAEWYQYAQEVEQSAQTSSQMGMPLSSREEVWVESALANPYGYAKQAALNGNVQLYQAVLARVAEDNPGLAAQVGAQVQIEMSQMSQVDQSNGAPRQTLEEVMNESIQRLGIDLSVYGEPMSAKIGELGEYHPYVQTILDGDPNARDIALMAVYDLVRSTAMSTRKVRSEERENQIKQEAELRRQAAGVVTGGPVNPQPPKQSPFMDAMEQEWRERGQWGGE